ncbi:ATP-binding cassette domain-containing protein [Kamptonema cortianum]|nr:ATP-binding cassette domain-containing protein [Kamptonema cortianum]
MISDIDTTDTVSPDPFRGTPCLLSLECIRKSYPSGEGELEILHGVDLRIHAGEFVAIMGPSGSGKTTLMNLLGLMDTPTSGRLLIEGADVLDMDEDDRARLRCKLYGFIFQRYNLFIQPPRSKMSKCRPSMPESRETSGTKKRPPVWRLSDSAAG